MAGPGPEVWRARLDAWLAPFLAALPRAEQRRWAPLYVQGLLLPGERKSIEPMAARVCPGEVQQLHHFVSASSWPHARLERVLAEQAERLVGGPDAVLIVDDTALVKQGRHSVGVQRQYCGQLGKRANCQVLVSLTLARDEVPIPVALRLFLPDAWVNDAERRRAARVPETVEGRPKWRIALDEIARLRAQGVRFGCVLGDAEYGKVAAFRHALDAEGLLWALGIPPTQKVFSTHVTTAMAEPARPGGRASTRCPPNRVSRWRRCSPTRLTRRFAPCPGAPAAKDPCRRRLRPGACAWLMARLAPPGSTCPARSAGWCASTAAPASASSTSPTIPPRPRWNNSLPRSKAAGAASRRTSNRRKNWASTTMRGAPGAACTTTRCCARSRWLSCNPCGLGKKSRQPHTPAASGPPPRPTLPEVRRYIIEALLDHLTRCPACGHPTLLHMLM